MWKCCYAGSCRGHSTSQVETMALDVGAPLGLDFDAAVTKLFRRVLLSCAARSHHLHQCARSVHARCCIRVSKGYLSSSMPCMGTHTLPCVWWYLVILPAEGLGETSLACEGRCPAASQANVSGTGRFWSRSHSVSGPFIKTLMSADVPLQPFLWFRGHLAVVIPLMIALSVIH